MPDRLRGRCLCGEVEYELCGRLSVMGHCHCLRCRRFGGTSYHTWIEVHPRNFRLLRGTELLFSFFEEGFTERFFCRQCSSGVYGDSGGFIYIDAGTLDGDPGIRPQVHIYVASKAPWVEITDELPRFDVGPPDGTLKVTRP